MAIQFEQNTLLFDFIQLDFSDFLIDPSFQDKLIQENFNVCDASAIYYVSKEELMSLFWVRFKGDLSDSLMEYTIDASGWPDVYFAAGVVSTETSVNPRLAGMRVAEDFVRSIFRDILGFNGACCLFANIEEMVTDVQVLDTTINQYIRYKISNVFNQLARSPSEILVNHVINDTDNRRNIFMNDMVNKMTIYESEYEDTLFYVYGNDGVHGQGYYYPLSLKPLPGYEPIQLMVDRPMYISTQGKRGSMFLEEPGVIDYFSYLNHYLPISFIEGDTIKVRIQYQHSEPIIYNKVIQPRSYMFYLRVK